MTDWISDKICEAYEKAMRTQMERVSVVQDIMLCCTDFLRRIIAPVGWQGGVTLSYVCPHWNCFPPKDYIWWVSKGHGKKHCGWWCAKCGNPYEWKAPNWVLVVQTGADVSQAKVYKAHVAPQGLCENLINALKLLANQQDDGDSPIPDIVTGLHEKT